MMKIKNPIKGLYAVTPEVADNNRLLLLAEQVLSGGARTLQYRDKSSDGARRLTQARLLLQLCRRHDACFIINDDPQLALAVEAHGVHIGRDDARLQQARELLGRDAIIGVSCYDDLAMAQQLIAAGADYIAFGAIFPSVSKPDADSASLASVSAASALGLPVVAIGGITLDNASSVIEAGADAIAVINALFSAADPRQAARCFSDLFLP
jgi:thiamine-phosphate pyrophosphorylase